MGGLTIEQKRTWVKGLMIACPVGKPSAKCPIKESRSLPIRERLKLVDAMDEEQLTEMIARHRACLRAREGVRPGPYG